MLQRMSESPARWTIEFALGAPMVVRRFGTGPELVWIHGLGDWSVSFDAIAAHPALAGYTHVLPDLPGYGRSPWLDVADSIDATADRLAAWLAGRRPIVIGHSLGGVLVTLLGERDAARAIIDVDGNLSSGDCTFSARAAAYSIDDFVAHGFDAMRSDIFDHGRTDPSSRGYYAGLRASSPHSYHRHATELVALSAPETLGPRLAALPVPTLFIAGEPDGICAYSRALLAALPLRHIALGPSGHNPHIDQPDAFAREVAAFLRGV